ncbi:MAG: aldehyde ferredoxin oxidoreductase family protein [Anaerolineae bacterium]
MHGYNGQILHVDLSSGELEIESPDERFYRRYVGGWNFIAYYLLKELPPRIDPLGPENMLIFATGPVTGVPIAGAGRSHVGAKSPLTGGFGEADVGGWWDAELTHAGFDAVIIRGQASEPVYLWIQDGAAEIRPARHLWGRLTADTQAALREELGDDRVRVAQIGPAGERLAPIAAVMHDVNRAAGRTGLGAVMGSKQLKAIAVRGTGRKSLAHPETLREIGRWYLDHYPTTWAAGLQENGTANGVFQHLSGGLPSYNFQKGTFDQGWEEITGERMTATILKDRDTCFACPVRCKRVVEVTKGPYRVDPTYGGPEYETVGAFGSCCGVGDLPAIARANQLCNAYGLDTISCGVTIAWAMECFERGLLTTDDTAGLVLRFGDAEAMVRAVELIGRREAFGEILSQGAARAAQRIGRGSEAYAMHVKGEEIPMHEPRVKFGLGIGYTTSPTGADHMHNFHDTSFTGESGIADIRKFGILDPLPYDDLTAAKMRLARIQIPWRTLSNVLGFCMFVSGSFTRKKVLAMVEAITGWSTSLYELLQAGERAYTMARAFNVREGFTPASDRLPDRFFDPFEEGPSQGNALPRETFEQARVTFYRMMGWNPETGVPEDWKLEELDVAWVKEAMQR